MAIHAHAASALPMLPPLRLDERAPAQLQLPSIHELLPEFEKMSLSMPPHADTPPRRAHGASPYARRDSLSPVSPLTSVQPHSPGPHAHAHTMRLVLVSSWADADVALALPISHGTPARPSLVFGADFARFKQGGYVPPHGVRMHPYRLHRGPPAPGHAAAQATLTLRR